MLYTPGLVRRDHTPAPVASDVDGRLARLRLAAAAVALGPPPLLELPLESHHVDTIVQLASDGNRASRQTRCGRRAIVAVKTAGRRFALSAG